MSEERRHQIRKYSSTSFALIKCTAIATIELQNISTNPTGNIMPTLQSLGILPSFRLCQLLTDFQFPWSWLFWTFCIYGTIQYVAYFCHFGITHNSNDWSWRNTEEVCDSTSPTNLPGILQNPFASHNKVERCLFEPHFTTWELWHTNMIVCLSQVDFELRSLRKQLPDTHYHAVSEISL